MMLAIFILTMFVTTVSTPNPFANCSQCPPPEIQVICRWEKEEATVCDFPFIETFSQRQITWSSGSGHWEQFANGFGVGTEVRFLMPTEEVGGPS